MIELDGVGVDFPGFSIRDVSLTIRTGEFFAVIGPTGAGKSVLLEAVAGLVPVSRGRIRIHGRDATHRVPEERGLGIVYQDHALFPHLSVRENITFGPRVHRVGRDVTRRRLDRLVAELSLEAILERSIHGLSGGERQRVALARALIVEPSILVLDEPLASLDPGFRYEVHALLKRLHEGGNITFIIVSHDFDEVLFLAQRVALMNRGRIVQVGPCDEVFRRPTTPFAASFVGMGNVFKARGDGSCPFLNGFALPDGFLSDRHDHVGIRPEEIVLARKGTRPTGSEILHGSGTVHGIVKRGGFLEVLAGVGATQLLAHVPLQTARELDLAVGTEIDLRIPLAALHTF